MNLHPDKAIEIAADVFGCGVRAITGVGKSRPLARARWAVAFALKEDGYSASEIGRFLNRDHSTILYAITEVRKRIRSEPLFAEKMNRYLERLERIDRPNLLARVDVIETRFRVVRRDNSKLAAENKVLRKELMKARCKIAALERARDHWKEKAEAKPQEPQRAIVRFPDTPEAVDRALSKVRPKTVKAKDGQRVAARGV